MILPELSLVLDVLIACLLVAVIIYALRLNKSLSVLQQSKAELEKMLSGFSESTEKAELAIQKVKEASTHNRDSLNKLLSEAETLREDLAFMIERGNSLADKLDGGISRNRVSGDAGEADAKDDIETAMRAARQAASVPATTVPKNAGQTAPRPLSAKPEDRGSAGAQGANLPATQSDASESTENKGKSKSALLRALQGMR